MTEARHSRQQSPQSELLKGTLLEQASVEQSHTIEKKEPLDRAKLMRDLYERSGFYARDTIEQSSMHAILEHAGKPFENPVADYLFEVSRKQDSLGEDPLAAPLSIVHQFEEHATLGDTEARFAGLFLKTLKDRHVQPDEVFSEVFTADYLNYDDPSLRTLTSIVRRIEDEAYAYEGQGKYPLAVRNGIDALKRPERQHRVQDVLESMTIESVEIYADQIRTEENRRFKYWQRQLLQASAWEPVEKQATRSLAALPERRKS